MHDSSIFNICIDFEKSHDSYIFDKNRQCYFLDFFGLYSSVPLGYSHPVFKDEAFLKEYNLISGLKVPNCEVISDEAKEFLKEFSGHPAMASFKNFHFSCTGALAIEAAIKTAIDQKKPQKPIVIGLKESFHGINSYGGFITDRFYPVSKRLDGFPEGNWPKIHNPKLIYKADGSVDESASQKGIKQFSKEFNEVLKQHGADNIVALVIEPIQSTFGDNYFSRDFFKLIRELCDSNNIALIFDEIQTGFGTSGTLWYFEQTGIIPDIVVFGKKAQISGIMVKDKFSRIFEHPIKLEVTWDGDLNDMVRCKYILKAYKEYNIFDNVNQRGQELLNGLKEIKELKAYAAADY